MSETFCPLPWIHQTMKTNGSLRICCAAENSKSKGLLKKESGAIFNAKGDSLKKARNAKILKQTRLDMLKGRHPEPCLECRENEQVGLLSPRQHNRKRWEKIFNFKKAQEVTKKDGSIDISKTPLVQYDLRLSNVCNLKCRMCYPSSSHSWYEDYVKIQNTNHFFDSQGGKITLKKNSNGMYKTQDNNYDWTDSPHFWKQIEENINNIKRIRFAGGEPLLIKKHYDLLEKIIKKNVAHKMSLGYMTNLTKLPKKALNLWSHFNYVLVGVSFDGYGPLNNYIRHPSQWEELEDNFNKLCNSKGNLNIWIETTAQAYNILHFPSFLKWGLSKYFKRAQMQDASSLIRPNLLYKPHYLNIKILPPAYKSKVKNECAKFMIWLDKWCIQNQITKKDEQKLKLDFKKDLDSLIHYMLSEDWSHLLPQFIDYTQKLDKIRKEKMKNILPELYTDIYDWQFTKSQSIKHFGA